MKHVVAFVGVAAATGEAGIAEVIATTGAAGAGDLNILSTGGLVDQGYFWVDTVHKAREEPNHEEDL